MMTETEPAANTSELELTHVDRILAAVHELETGDTLTYELPGDDRVQDLTVDAVETGDEWTEDDHTRAVFLNGPRGGSYTLRDRYPVETTEGSHVHRLTITGRANGTVQDLAETLHADADTITGREVRILKRVPDDVDGFHSPEWSYGFFGDDERVTLFIASEPADIHVWTKEGVDTGGEVRVSAPKDAGEDIKALDWGRVQYTPEYGEDGEFYWKVSARSLHYMMEELTREGYTVTFGQNAARKAGDYRNQGRYDLPGVGDDGEFLSSEHTTSE